MLVAYWIVAALLALMYVFSGSMKLVRSQEKLRPMMPWVDEMPMAAVRTIGALELLGAVGLILPPLLGIAPWLAFAAAIGLVLVQIGAIIVHLRRGDRQIVINIVLLVLAAIEVWLATIWL